MIDIRAVCKVFLDFVYEKVLPGEISKIIDFHDSKNEPKDSIKWDIRVILCVLKYREKYRPAPNEGNQKLQYIKSEIAKKSYLLSGEYCDSNIRRWLLNNNRQLDDAVNFCNSFFHNVENDAGIETFCVNLRELIKTSKIAGCDEYICQMNKLINNKAEEYGLTSNLENKTQQTEVIKKTEVTEDTLPQDLKSEILNFIKKPLPKNLNVVSGSVPVPFFGDINTAQAATISINPSNNEFCIDNTTKLLPEEKKRFCDRECLGISDSDMLSDEQAEEVFSSYCEYFKGNPYKKWFSKLGNFIGDVSNKKFSYDNGSMIHLDIAPYATYPIWSFLSEDIKERLFTPYHSIGLKIFEKSHLKYLFINGRKTKESFEKYFNIKLTLTRKLQAGKRPCEIYTGEYQHCKIIAWNLDVPNGAPNQQKYEVREVFNKMNDSIFTHSK